MVRRVMFCHALCKAKRVPVVFLAEDSIDEFCNPRCSRGVLLGMNVAILLAMVRHGCCFTVENIG